MGYELVTVMVNLCTFLLWRQVDTIDQTEWPTLSQKKFQFKDHITTIIGGREFEKVCHGNYLIKFELEREKRVNTVTFFRCLQKYCK